jgi:uncharacterized membrane protein
MQFNPVKTFFKSLGTAVVSGAIGFFMGVFLSIVALAIYAALSKQTPDFTLSYKFIGAPFGALVFVAVFIGMFVRDMKRIA